jgi:hypothetical protein
LARGRRNAMRAAPTSTKPTPKMIRSIEPLP